MVTTKKKTMVDEHLSQVRDEIILSLQDFGFKVTDIAKIMNMTKQRISQIIKSKIKK